MARIHSPHLTELITRFYEIGRSKYNGRIYDNVLNIFEELDIEDQKALLRGTLGMYVAATTEIIHERELIDQGDYAALLLHLKRSKEMDEKDGTLKEKVDEAKIVPPPQKEKFEDAFIRFSVITCLATIVVGCIHLVILSMSDDPEALSKAKFYLTLFEMFTQ